MKRNRIIMKEKKSEPESEEKNGWVCEEGERGRGETPRQKKKWYSRALCSVDTSQQDI
jgi:hypothetical protein